MTRPTIAEINLSSIQQNVIQLKKISPNSLCYPVVKANAYGHGLKKVVEAIDALINGYCVATSEEAINLRRLTSKSIVCLEGPYNSNELRSLILKNIDFVIHSHRQLVFLNKEEIPYVMYNALPNTIINGSIDSKTIYDALDMKRFFEPKSSHYEYVLDKKLIVSPNDPHPSTEGHKQWSQMIKEYIDVNNLRSI